MGARINQIRRDNFPGVGAYKINPKKDGPEYSIARSNYNPLKNSNSNPGPMDYSPKKIGLKEYPKYSMRQKFNPNKPETRPGPGYYNPKSKFIPKFWIPKEPRDFGAKDNNIPGPIYNPNKIGLKNYPSYSIRGKFQPNDNESRPGPGEYSPNQKYPSKNYR